MAQILTKTRLKKHSGLITLASAGIAVMLMVGHMYIKPLLIKQAIARLNTDFQSKQHSVKNYIDQQVKQLQAFALDKNTIDFLVNSRHTDDDKKAYANFIQGKVGKNALDAFLLNQDGSVLLSLNQKKLENQNIRKAPLNQTALGHSFQHTVITFSPDISLITKNSSNNDYSIFISIPVLNNNKFLGVFSTELSLLPVFSELLNNHNSYSSVQIYLANAFNKKTNHIPLSQEQAKQLVARAPFLKQLSYASRGNFSAQTITTQNGEFATVSGYLPDMHAGLILAVKTNVITQATTFIFIIALALILLLLAISFILHENKKVIVYQLFATVKNPLQVINNVKHYLPYALLGITLCGTFIIVAKYLDMNHKYTTKAHVNANTTMRYISQQINNTLYTIQDSANYFANTVSRYSLSEAETTALVEQLFKHHKHIFSLGIAYQPNTIKENERLHGHYWTQRKQTITKHTISSFYDYTLPEAMGKASTSWYLNAVKGTSSWQDPYFDVIGGKKILSYSTPFYHPQDTERKFPIGAIVVGYKTSSLRLFIEEMGNRTALNSVLINDKGHLIYHPDVQQVLNHKTIFDITPDKTKDPIETLEAYLANATDNFAWSHYENIGQTNWTLGSAFTENQIIIPTQKLLNIVILFIIFFVLTLFLCFMFLIKQYIAKERQSLYIVITYCTAAIFSTLGLWHFIYHQEWHPGANEVAILDNAALKKFLAQINQTAMSKNQPQPVPIKTGIVINQIEASDPNETNFIANIWQVYHNTQHKDIKPGFTITKAKKVKVRELYRKKSGDYTIVAWHMRCLFYQLSEYTRYPFNKKHVVVSIAHTNDKFPVICVPDFARYTTQQHDENPWLDRNANILERLEKSFFSYKKQPRSLSVTTTNRKMKLHMILRENLTTPFMNYLVPLIVILFSIFSLLWLSVDSQINGLSGIFFAAVVLHHSLRSALDITSIIYLEYFLFFTYLTLLFLIVFSIAPRIQKFFGKDSYDCIKLYFWPVQLTLWLTMTTWIFYR